MGSQVMQEVQYLWGILCYFGGDGVFGVIGEVKQCGQFGVKCQDVCDVGVVVECGIVEFGGLFGIGVVQCFMQWMMIGVGLYWQVVWYLQC